MGVARAFLASIISRWEVGAVHLIVVQLLLDAVSTSTTHHTHYLVRLMRQRTLLSESMCIFNWLVESLWSWVFADMNIRVYYVSLSALTYTSAFKPCVLFVLPLTLCQYLYSIYTYSGSAQLIFCCVLPGPFPWSVCECVHVWGIWGWVKIAQNLLGNPTSKLVGVPDPLQHL